MREIYANESRTFVLYPSPDAMDIENLPREQAFNLIVIDGTWNQARSLYFANKELHSLTKVCKRTDLYELDLNFFLLLESSLIF